MQIVYEIDYLHKSLDDFSKIRGLLGNSQKLIWKFHYNASYKTQLTGNIVYWCGFKIKIEKDWLQKFSIGSNDGLY